MLMCVKSLFLGIVYGKIVLQLCSEDKFVFVA